MRLTLQRNPPDSVATSGRLSIDGAFECYTLERIPPVSIAAGIYPVRLTWSPDFKRTMPAIFVPAREGIRIHWGNYSYDSEGCVLTGTRMDGSDVVEESRTAFEALYARLLDEIPGSILIQVIDAPITPLEAT